jgi:hypothetical protein
VRISTETDGRSSSRRLEIVPDRVTCSRRNEVGQLSRGRDGSAKTIQTFPSRVRLLVPNTLKKAAGNIALVLDEECSLSWELLQDRYEDGSAASRLAWSGNWFSRIPREGGKRRTSALVVGDPTSTDASFPALRRA